MLTADTPRTTVEGATFIAPAGWSITVRGPATILEAPEAGSRLALVDVGAANADAAVDQAWAAYRPDRPWKLEHKGKRADGDGWTDTTQYAYATSPDERRDVFAQAMRHDQTWTVAIYDMARAVGEKRSSQLNMVFDGLLPEGYRRESFAGRTAHRLDAARLAELTRFVDHARELFDVPAISFGVLQDGKIVFGGGFGVRELGKPDRPDADTLYIIASTTKALTTLLLAKLVDEHRLTWDSPVIRVMPSFKLGDEATTRSVLVKHLILTNAQADGIIRELLRRKLLEVLFDGQPLADAQLAAAAKELREQIAADRPHLTVPPTDDAARLAPRYTSAALGDLDIARDRGAVVFDFGEWRSPVASRHNPDGSVSFVLIAPGLRMRELVAGERDGKRTLTIRDGQHEYVFVER
ncbi:MAG TPA: serine hydrolase [Kofleriaceae bacterium]|nr:serine hydrolase [Kofleriaceae bacterium]